MSMKKSLKFLPLLAVLLFVLPGITAILFQKNVRFLWEDTQNVERYLPGMLFRVIGEEMEEETLKAQAVILRSNLMISLQEKTVTYADLREQCSLIKTDMAKEDLAFYKKLEEISKETEGEVITYEGNVCYCPFFYASSGTTREAFAFFEDGSYPYLIAVPSHRDEESIHYITYHHFSMEEFREKMNELCQNTYQNRIEILEKDDSDYITWLKIEETIVGGEVFREKLGLSSACFSIEQKENGIRITCKGRGHGFGFSQYGANAMAVDGKGYRELLEYYFHNITIENVNRFS